MKIRWILLLLIWMEFSSCHSFMAKELLETIYSKLEHLLNLESHAPKSRSGFNKGHSSITKPSKEAVSKYEESLLLEIATREGGTVRLPRNTSPSRCDTLRCSPSEPYPKLDGACNNIWKNRRWGARLQPLSRILPSVYEDHISNPKIRNSDGVTFLPSPRLVSNTFHNGQQQIKSTHHNHSLMTMQWGQFLDHDVSFTPNIRSLRSREAFNCNSCDSSISVHPSCFPIIVPKNDPYFPPFKHKTRCMTFTRSMPGQMAIGKRQQLNQNTAFLDASHIYGSSVCDSNSLRKFKNGHLRVRTHPKQLFAKPLMPMKDNIFECGSSFGMCFHSGDDRSNEQPGLTSLHTLLVREHNRICDMLKIYNPQWSDGTLFQEARKILRAINQHITYGEFLPRILSHKVRKKYGLILEKGHDYFSGYDSSCSPAIFNEFSAAAFRFGHTLVAPIIRILRNAEGTKDLMMRRHFNNPDVMRKPKFIDHLMGGLSSQKIQDYDSVIEFDLRNRLFEESQVKNRSFVPHSGLDLAALNIQRGRDHGIPGYIKYWNWCTNDNIRSFKDLTKVFNETIVKKLRSVYRTVEDIDLFTGGILEESLEGGLVGETFGCIIGLQFKHLRSCDRYWFENPFPYMRFTKPQLKEIRKITLASITCKNCDLSPHLQRELMDVPNNVSNPKVECSSLPNIDFRHWIDQRGKNSSSVDAQYYFCEVYGRIMKSGERHLRVSGCTECSCPLEGGKATCQTMNVGSCSDLIHEIGEEEVRSEENCFIQCSHIMNNTQS